MKRTHIIALILIALSIGAVMATLADASTYVGFEQADSSPGSIVTVIGTLDRSQPMNYDAEAGQFTFFALDKEGARRKVVFMQPKPTDFERSEEITMKGKSLGSDFVATEILMKCPSKYEDQAKVGSETAQAGF